MSCIIFFVIGLVVGSYNALKIRAFIVSLTQKAGDLAKHDEGNRIPPVEK